MHRQVTINKGALLVVISFHQLTTLNTAQPPQPEKIVGKPGLSHGFMGRGLGGPQTLSYPSCSAHKTVLVKIYCHKKNVLSKIDLRLLINSARGEA